MTPEEANTMRCLAHELIIKLWEANETGSLELLGAHVEAALQRPYKKESESEA